MVNDMVEAICVNCGAVLDGNECKYCGTKYNTFDGFTVTMIIDGEARKFYTEKQEVVFEDSDIYRDCNGILNKKIGKKKLRLTLMEI